MSYLGLASPDGIAGVSEGNGLPGDFVEIDLSIMNGCTCTDDDGDGVCNEVDNCLDVSNPNQVDSNQDGYGNLCDTDLNDDNAVGVPDFNEFRSVFGLSCSDPGYDADADFHSDCAIGVPDFNIFRTYFGGPPGPSGYACAGTIPCPAASVGGSVSPAGAAPDPEAGGPFGPAPVSANGPSAVPALGPGSLGVLASLIAVLGLASVRKRRQTPPQSRARKRDSTA